MSAGSVLLFILILIFSFFIYFLPTFVAAKRSHQYAVPIFFVNFFFGWSLIGWIFTLIWAYSDSKQEQQQITINQTQNIQTPINVGRQDTSTDIRQDRYASIEDRPYSRNKTNSPFPKLILDENDGANGLPLIS